MKKLREFRQKLGLNQVDFSVKLDISYQTLRKYESGVTKKMKPQLEKKISNMMGEEYNYQSLYDENKEG